MGGGPVPAMALNLAHGLLAVAGTWLLTTPDPSGLGEDRYGTSRKVIRVTLAVGLAQQLINLVLATTNLSPSVNLVVRLASSAAALAGVVGQFATLSYLGKLAMRIPDPSLAERARLLMYGLGVPMAVFVLTGIVAVVAMRGRGGPGAGLLAIGCVAGLCGIALIVFGIMYLLMLVRFSTRLREQAAVAASTWARPPLAPPPLAVPAPGP